MAQPDQASGRDRTTVVAVTRCDRLGLVERVWVFDNLAVAVARIDFIDPAVAHLPDARERGVRVEIRAADAVATGSVYVSSAISLRPALCRVDLLESRPGACDRMHWHPDMSAGEPRGRVFDESLSADPLGWLATRLADIASLVDYDGHRDADDRDDRARYAGDASAVASAADEIVGAVREGLAWAREPWPAVDHDERGMALA